MREIDFSDAQKDGKGFQFPGEFEITAIGSATAGLDKLVPALLHAVGLEVLHETLSTKLTPAGNYQSVTVSFVAASREKYLEAHSALRADENIRFTM
jgi:putative lipoic acid-binding regulatory protein